MRKSGHRKRKPGFWNITPLIVIAFAMLIMLPASFFIADLISLSPQGPQGNANGAQTALAPKTSPLFDVKVSILPEYKTVVAGSKVLATVTMKNLGSPGNPIDVELAISIIDTKNNVTYSYSRDTVAVATQLTLVREVIAPAELKAGTYFFAASVKYDRQIAEAYDSFVVTEPRIEIKNNIIIYALGILLVVLAIAVILLLKHHLGFEH